MRPSALPAVLALLCASLFLFCEKEATPTAPGLADLPGTWVGVIPVTPPFVTQAISVTLAIDSATSGYDLQIVKDGDAVPLLTHNGSWTTVSGTPYDTVVLSGSQCFIIDTTATPDTLMPLSDDVCGLPIKLPVNLTSPTTWPIKVGDLGPIVEAFPIPQAVKPYLQGIVLPMQKQ
jgi:hypothetical protein